MASKPNLDTYTNNFTTSNSRHNIPTFTLGEDETSALPLLQQEQRQSSVKRILKHTKNLSSSGNSYSHRDSRVQSIYDIYLYRQESKKGHLRKESSLGRKLSRKSTKRVNSIKRMASQARSQAAAATQKKRQSNAAFAEGSKGDHEESQAWAGMMTGDISSDDSDSDSDNERPAPRVPVPSSNGSGNKENSSRASWSSRAAAVGSRPPDSASQNPPTLKLLGLRSVKEGGVPIGNNGSRSPTHLTAQQARERGATTPAFDMVAGKDRIVSTSDYGDELDRHNSYIEFGGADGFGGGRESQGKSRGLQLEDGPVNPASSSLEPPRSPIKQPVSPTTALTQQLGLVTPQPPPPSNQGPRPVEQESYFPPIQQSTQQRNLMTNTHQMQQQDRLPPRGMAPIAIPIPSTAQSIPLQRGQPSPHYPVSPPRGSSNQNHMRMTSGPGPTPAPIPLPSPVYPVPPPIYSDVRSSQDNRFGPSGPGFSDSPQIGGGGRQMNRKPSLLRRSMAFISGQDAPQSYPSQQQYQQGGVNNGQRKSFLRRSMAFLTGRPMMPAPIEPEREAEDDAHAPQPRVRGFVDEKPKNRKSEYLGASGMGDEWDYSGYGAKFWKRFSAAQRKEASGQNQDSTEFRAKTERRRKMIMITSLLGGILIIGAVVGIVIWRETIPSSAIPGAVDREYNGVDAASVSGGVDVNADANTASQDTSYTSQTDYGASEPSTTSTTTKHHHHNNNNRREQPTSTGLVEAIRREVEGSSNYYGGIHPLPRGFESQLIRRRKHAARSPEAEVTPAPHVIS